MGRKRQGKAGPASSGLQRAVVNRSGTARAAVPESRPAPVADPRRRVIGLVLTLAVALAVRLVNLGWMSAQPIAEYQFEWAEADMGSVWDWSGRILHGDPLSRDTYHQYTAWRARIAPLETWERWWGGKHVFHWAPLYPYAVAVMRLVAGDGFWGIGLCQLALGLVNVGLVFALADRFFGLAVAVLSGLGAALYGPFLLHETLVLRDNLAVTTSLLLLWALSRCHDAAPRRWLVAGLLFAVALLAREVTLLFGPFVVLWMAQRFRHESAALRTALASFLGGVLLGLLPLVGRNLVVGAPPLALSALANEAFIYGHAAGSRPAGFSIPGSAPSILREADGRFVDAVRLTLASYQGDWGRLVRHEVARLAAIFASFEGSDNVNWYYFADRSALLRFALRYEFVLALGLVGLWLARAGAAGDDRLLRYFLLAAVLGLQYSMVMGRYRLPPAAVLIVYGALTVYQVTLGAWELRWKRVVPAALAVAGIVTGSRQLLGATAAVDRYRPTEFAWATRVYERRHQLERAYEELREGVERAYVGPDERRLSSAYLVLAQAFADFARRSGQIADAAAVLERLSSRCDEDERLRQLLGSLRRDLGRG